MSGTQLWRHEAAGVVEHPELSGLYLMRAAVEPSGVSAIRALVDAVIHPPRSRGVHGEAEAASREAEVLLQQSKLAPAGSEEAVEAAEIASASLARRDALRARAAEQPPPPPVLRTPTAWEWYPFEPGRWMAPMRPHPAEGGTSATAQRAHLNGFEVFDSADVTTWLSLECLEREAAKGGDGGLGGIDILAHAGTARLRRLQAEARSMLPCIASLPQPALCAFHQFQLLERGARIASHVDAPLPPADVVATLSLGAPCGIDDDASSTVRVGHVRISLRAGDLYAISGAARWQVAHAVDGSTSDRLSLTMRYAGGEQLT